MRVWLVLAILLVAAPAFAHKPSDAHLRLAADGATLAGRFDLSVRDLDNALVLDTDGNGTVTWGELTSAMPRITAYITQRLVLSTTGPCPLAFGAPAITALSDGAYAVIPIRATCPTEPGALAIRYSLFFDVDAQHRGIVVFPSATVVARDGTTALHVTLPVRPSILHRILTALEADAEAILLLLLLWVPLLERPEGVRRGLSIQLAFSFVHAAAMTAIAAGLPGLPPRAAGLAAASVILAAAVMNLARRELQVPLAIAGGLVITHGGILHGPALVVVGLALAAIWTVRRNLAYRILLYAGSTASAVLAALWLYERWTS